MERPIFHLRWEREALYRRKPNQTKQKNKKNTRTRTHTHTTTTTTTTTATTTTTTTNVFFNVLFFPEHTTTSSVFVGFFHSS